MTCCPKCGSPACLSNRTPTLAFQLGRTLPGAGLRILDEMRRAIPPPVWPERKLLKATGRPAGTPLFLYPIGRSRQRVVALKSRVQRFRKKALEAAVRQRYLSSASIRTT